MLKEPQTAKSERKETHSIEEMHEIAELRYGRCLSKEYANMYSKLIWQCSKSHIWEMIPAVILQGAWCPQCTKEEIREEKKEAKKQKKLEELKEIAIKKGGMCLSDKYVNRDVKLKWQCKEGHIWESVPEKIRAGHWCPRCYFNSRKNTLEKMQKIAEERGGKCLSTTYIDRFTKMTWQCAKGHIWEQNLLSIRRQWCLECYEEKVKYARFEKLKHFVKEKGGLCLSDKYTSFHTKMKFQCDKGHIWETTSNILYKGSWCPRCAGIAKLSIEDAKSLALQKNGKCLSRVYINNRANLIWQCEKGHRWKASFHSVKDNDTWCPVCAIEQKPDANRILSKFIEGGGKCLSDTQNITSNSLVTLQCKKGHVFEKRLKRYVMCPQCHSRVIYNINDMQEIAAKKGGRCLSPKYINSITKLEWECTKGHTWYAKPDKIKQGRWCPACARIQNIMRLRGAKKRLKVQQ